jgi:hypothetical protein
MQIKLAHRISYISATSALSAAKIIWPEKNMTINLVGTRGEIPNLHLDPQKTWLQPVPDGTIILGYELHKKFT